MAAKDPRAGRMLSIAVPADLMAALHDETARRGCTLASLARRLLQAGLEAAPEPSADDARLVALESRLAAVEVRLEALAAAPAPVRPRPRREADAPPRQQQQHDAPLADGAISTSDLARHLGLKPNALNERIRRAGGARVGLELQGWRCVGQQPSPTGGPPRWHWSPA